MNDQDFEEGWQREARKDLGEHRDIEDNKGLFSEAPSPSSNSSWGNLGTHVESNAFTSSKSK